MSGSPDRLQPATPELQRDFDQKKIRTEQILQALDVESQLQTLNQKLYSGKGKITHVHEVVTLSETKSYPGFRSSFDTRSEHLLSGIALQPPEDSILPNYVTHPSTIFVGSVGHQTENNTYSNNAIAVGYATSTRFRFSGSVTYGETGYSKTLGNGYDIYGVVKVLEGDWGKIDIENPYSPSASIDRYTVAKHREQVKEKLDMVEDREKKRIENKATPPTPNQNTTPSLNNPALGHAQAAQQAEMARRAREYAQRTGTGTSSELPTPYNPPTTTPEWRGTQPSNRPGPIDPATGRPRPPQKPPGW